MLNSLLFKIKADVDIDKHKLLELFFKDWVDNTCENKVEYKIENVPESAWIYGRGTVHGKGIPSYETFRVEFENREDALALKLKGIPDEFQHYLEIIE